MLDAIQAPQSRSVSLVLTLYERDTETLHRVFDSLADVGEVDQLVVVLDRTPADCADLARSLASDTAARLGCRLDMPRIDGSPGWRCPSAAWNTGFTAADSDILYAISSDVVQAAGNVDRAMELQRKLPCVIFGSCVERDVDLAADDRATLPVLCSATHPRPLGFILCLPAWMVARIGGYDEGFMEGLWCEDVDFMYRIWELGCPFVFDDAIHGVHQTHGRPELDPSRVAVNRAYQLRKWGRRELFDPSAIAIARDRAGRTFWLSQRRDSNAR